MSAIASSKVVAEERNAPTSGRLFFLDLSGGRILSANPDGSDLKTVITERRKLPDFTQDDELETHDRDGKGKVVRQALQRQHGFVVEEGMRIVFFA